MEKLIIHNSQLSIPSPLRGSRRGAFFFTTTKATGRDPQLLCPELGVPTDRFYRPHQVHGTSVEVVTEETLGAPMSDADAVIYNLRNACIGISTADCIPVLCYDPEHHCAAAIHAGWRGTVARIVEKAVAAMQQQFGTQPSVLQCVIGPSIGVDSFEVGDEVYEAFFQAGFDMSRMSVRKQKWHLDIKECNRMQLLSAGVKPENIHVSDIDTMTDDRFFSARREGAATGRILSGIVLL